MSINAADYLDAHDAEWRRQLHTVSLVAEVESVPKQVDQTLQLIGRRYRQLCLRGEDGAAAQLLRRWPAVQVLAMVQVATDHYEQGNFWTPFCARTGLRPDADVQRAWGGAFVGNLARLRLPTFDEVDSGSKYVGRVLMHTGMPTYCLPDFFALLASRRRADRGISGASFVAWAAAEAERGTLYVDKPVVRFLRYGGDYAIDVADRALDLVDDLLTGGDGARALLPSRFASVARDLVAEHVFDDLRGRRRTVVQEEQNAAPRLVLDPYGRGLLVRLPAISDSPDGLASWHVIVDGKRETVQSRALWPGNNEPAPAADLPLARAARAALVSLGTRSDAPVSVVPIVDAKDPILFFDSDGDQLPGSLPLPNSAVWLLYPADAGGQAAVAYEGSPRVIATGRMPSGWAGWQVELVDLADTRSVGLVASGHGHQVRGMQSARVHTGEPIEVLRTPYGSAIYSAVPEIYLPSSGGGDVDWEIAIADGRGNVLIRRSVSQPEEAARVWEKVPRPLLGAYRIQVRGPWGRGTSRNVVLAEGVDVSTRPALRRFGRGGLAPAVAQIGIRSGLSVDQRSLTFGPSRVSAPVVFSRDGLSETFVLTPPHMAVSYETTGSVGRERLSPLSLETDALLDDPGVLSVRAGDDAQPLLHVLCGGTSVQSVPPAARAGAGVYRFDLRRVIDTVRDCGAATLALDPSGDVVVASVRPRRLATSATLLDGDLFLEGARDIEGLAVAVFLVRAPWRGPYCASVVDARAPLPDAYRDAGPMLVTVYIDDPWVPVVPPAWPEPADTMCVEAPGSLCSEDDDETALSAFLAGTEKFPERLADLSRLWIVLDRIERLNLGDRTSEVAAACRDALRAQPAAALAGLNRSGLSESSCAAALAASGVLPRVRAGSVVGDVHWSAAPVAAVLSLTARTMADDPSSLEVVNAIEHCGDAARAILNGEPDPHSSAGRFDEAADRYALMTREQRAAFTSAVAFVPKALLDVDTRSQAAVQLLDRSIDPRAADLRAAAGQLLREAQAFLQQVDDKRYYWAVHARCHPRVSNGWQSLSGLSLAFALLSRLAARQEHRFIGWLDSQSRHWAALARIAPELTSTDLVLAELLCLGAGRRQNGCDAT